MEVVSDDGRKTVKSGSDGGKMAVLVFGKKMCGMKTPRNPPIKNGLLLDTICYGG